MITTSDTRAFFFEMLTTALDRRHVNASEPVVVYLRDLLSDSAHRIHPTDAPIVSRFAEAIEVDDPREKRDKLRQTGDAALYTCGFFQEHVESRGMSVQYYAAMGGRAYATAASIPGPLRSVLGELAEKFESFADVLDEVRETTTLRTPQDIVKLYDRWRKTNSPRLAERLQREGVFPGAGMFSDDEPSVH